MLYATLALAATIFAATVLHVNSAPRNDDDVSVNELWKIRAYQEDGVNPDK